MPLVFKTETKTLEFEGGEVISVKRHLTYGDLKTLTKNDLQDDMVKCMIKTGFVTEWNLKDSDGNIAPINEETLSILDLSQLVVLIQEFQKLNESPLLKAA